MGLGGVEDQFYRLQAKLGERQVPGWDQGDQDIVVVPSLSVDQRELLKISGFLHYEERQLFHLIQLRQPRTRLVYITSIPLHPSIIEYYLQLLPGIPFSHARDRLLVLSVYDASPSPLTQKILERPRLIEQIRQAIRPERAWLTAYNATDLEQTLSVALGIPFLGPAAALQCWGTKRGSRQIFAECGIPHPVGTDLYHDPELLAEALLDLWHQAPHLRRWVVKLNAGFSGEGNALLDLGPLQLDSLDSPTQQVQAVLRGFSQMRFQAPGETWLGFSALMAEMGALAECFLEGDEKRSPSVQGLIHPGGRVEVLSTHEQILGGPDGQVYLGCRFPADAAYRATLHTLGLQVGEALARRGAIERYGVDFLVRRNPDNQTWDVQALEINLRQGGTTHPLMTLKLLTNGQYDPESGLFYSPHGPAKYYMATDNLQRPAYRGLLPNDLMDIIAQHQLHFDTSTETGAVFHLMGALSEFGKLGLTCIGNSPAQAEAIYAQMTAVLDRESQQAGHQVSPQLSPWMGWR